MSAHTPGPWHWVNNRTDEPFDFNAEFDGESFPSLRTVEEFGKNETIPWGAGTRTTRALPHWILDAEPMQNGNDEANARLIAAAPDLLAALIGLDEAFCNINEYSTREERHGARLALIAARSAVAKATGSTP